MSDEFVDKRKHLADVLLEALSEPGTDEREKIEGNPVSERRDDSTETEMDTPTLGLDETFGHYLLQCELGRGGMGVVYKAYDTRLKRTIALKVLAKADPQNLARLLREASAMAKLEHPNIVKIYEVGEMPASYIAMEYVDGSNLTGLIQKHRIKSSRAVEIAEKIAAAIEEAHKNGIIHRDIKPSNVMLTRQGEPKLTDFGLAKLKEESIALSREKSRNALSRSGDIVGTPAYMPPEQLEGKVDAKSDIYSIGATLYEMLTGCPPFQGETPWNVFNQIANKDPVLPRLLNPDISVYLEAICMKCLAKKPHRRYTNAKQLRKDLRNFVQQRPLLARPYTKIDGFKRFLARHKLACAAVICLAAILTLLGYGIVVTQKNTQIELEKIRAEKARAEERAARAQMKEMALCTMDVLSHIYASYPHLRKDMHLQENIRNVFKKLQKQNLDDLNLISIRAYIFQSLEDFDLVIERTDGDRVKSACAYFNRGTYYFNQKMYADAEKDFDKVIELDPKSASDAHDFLGQLSLDQKKYELAEKHFSRVLALNPSYIGGHVNRALAYRCQNRYAEAEQDYNRALEIDPHNGKAHYARGEMYLRLGKEEMAERDISRAIELSPTYGVMYYKRALIYYNQGKYLEAVADCEKAIELDSKLVREAVDLVYRIRAKMGQ